MKNSKIHSIRYNFVMNFILTASQFLFPLVTFPYVSRVLQAAGNGKVSFVASVANYFMMIASLGIPTYGVRACAQVRDDKDKLSKTTQEIFLINIVTTILVMITYTICLIVVPKFQAEKELFVINGINILLNMFGMNWLYQALEQYDYITVRSILIKILSVVLMFLLVHKQEDYVIYGAITVFAAVGSNILNFIRINKYINCKWYGKYKIIYHMKPIMILFAQSLAVSIYTNLDTVMLGFMKSDADVGFYNTAVKIKTILLSLVTSLGNVLLPRMSYYAKKEMKNEFRDTMVKALHFTFLLSVPLVIYFVLYAEESISFLAGNGYAGAVLPMQIITIAVIPTGLTGVLGVQVLTALEREKYVLYSVVTGAMVDLLLNIFFIPQYGAVGAAFATMIAEFVVLLVQVVATRKILQEVKRRLMPIRYLLLSIISASASLMIKKMDIHSTFIVLGLSAGAFFGVYSIGLLILREPIVLESVNSIWNKIKRN